MYSVSIIHFFSRTQLIFGVAALLCFKAGCSCDRVLLLPKSSNGVLPNYDGIAELFEKNKIPVEILDDQRKLLNYIPSSSHVTIYSPSTFPLDLFRFCLRRGASVRIVNIEEGIGSYLSKFNGIMSLFRRRWYILAFRRVLGILFYGTFKFFGFVELKRLIKRDLSICTVYRDSIVSVLNGLQRQTSNIGDTKRRQLLLPLSVNEYERWVNDDNLIFVKPHPRFSSAQEFPFTIPHEDLALTAEEVCIKYKIHDVIADHSSSLIYCAILCGTKSLCDTQNQWSITDETNLKMFDNFCERYSNSKPRE